MTAPAQVLIGTGGTSFVSPAVVLKDVVAGTNAAPYIYTYPSGAIAVGGNASTATPAAWLQPVSTGNPGAPFFVKLNINSGSVPNIGSSFGTVLAIAGNAYNWQWMQSAVGTMTANCTMIYYADAGGTQIVNSFTFSVTSQRTS